MEEILKQYGESGLARLLRETFGILPEDPLFQVETKVAQICTTMSKSPITIDEGKLYVDLKNLRYDLLDLESKIKVLSMGFLHPSYNSSNLATFLLQRGVPAHRLYNGPHTRPIRPSDMRNLFEFAPDVLPLVFDHRHLSMKLRSLESLQRRISREGVIFANFDSTSSKSGSISVRDPNLANPYLLEYTKPAKGKVFLSVSINLIIVYMLANILRDDFLYKCYILKGTNERPTDAFTYIASIYYATPEFAITSEQRQTIKSFLYSRLFPTSVDFHLNLQSGSENLGFGTEAHNSIFRLQELHPRIRAKKTLYGRTLTRPDLYMLTISTFADFEKMALVKLTEQIPSLKPVMSVFGDLTFEVAKTAPLVSLKQQIEDIYKSIIPEGWYEPTITIETK
jgi:hypothetical protein